jgi:hypothetical protein
MEVVVLLVAEGILLYTTRQLILQEMEVIQNWKSGTLSYDEIVALKKYKSYLVRKLNRKIKIGKHPGLFKKDN